MSIVDVDNCLVVTLPTVYGGIQLCSDVSSMYIEFMVIVSDV